MTPGLVNISLTRKLKVGSLISKYYTLAVIHRFKVNWSEYEKNNARTKTRWGRSHKLISMLFI